MDLGLALVLAAQVGTLGAGLLGAPVGVGEQVDLLAQAVDLGLAPGTLLLELRLYLPEPLLELLELLAILLRAARAGLELLAPRLLRGELVAQLAERSEWAARSSSSSSRCRAAASANDSSLCSRWVSTSERRASASSLWRLRSDSSRSACCFSISASLLASMPAARASSSS